MGYGSRVSTYSCLCPTSHSWRTFCIYHQAVCFFASRSTPLLPHPTQHRPYLHILPGVTMATKTRWNRRGESQHAVGSITRGADLFPLLSGLGEEDDPSRQRPRCHDGVLAGPENTRAWLSSCHQKSPVLA